MEGRIAFYFGQYLKAVHLGHDDVQQYEIKRLGSQQLQCPAAVFCHCYSMPLLFEADREGQPVGRVVSTTSMWPFVWVIVFLSVMSCVKPSAPVVMTLALM